MLNRNQVYCGDCLELMKDLDDKSVDMVLCDLPYGTTQNEWDIVIPLDKLWEHYVRVCKGAIVLTASQPFSSVLVTSNLNMFKYELIWKKNKFSNFLDANKRPMKQHENILVFYEQCVFNPQYWYSEPYKRWNKQRAVDKQTNYGKHKENVSESKDGRRQPISVIDFARHERPVHPTQKPVPLFEYLIKTFSNKGDLVLDNCAGVGTTGVACINTERYFILMDSDEEFCQKSKERIERAFLDKTDREGLFEKL